MADQKLPERRQKLAQGQGQRQQGRRQGQPGQAQQQGRQQDQKGQKQLHPRPMKQARPGAAGAQGQGRTSGGGQGAIVRFGAHVRGLLWKKNPAARMA